MEQTSNTQPRRISRGGKLSAHLSRNLFTYASLAIFAVLCAVFAVLSGGVSLSTTNLRTLLNSGILVSIAATSAVFVYSLGMLDISLGANVALGTVTGAWVYSVTGQLPVAVLCILAVTTAVSLLSGAVIGFFGLPAFIITLVMMNVLSSLNILLVSASSGGGNMIPVSSDLLRSLDTVPVKIACFAVVFLAAVFLFNFTRIGRQNKVIGANPLNAAQSGISARKNTVLSFIIMGMGLAVASFLLLTRVRAGSASNGSSYGFVVMLALVLGGMPISGGSRSNIFSGVLGAFILTELQIGLNAAGVDMASIQIVRGAAFLVILFALNFRTRSKYLI